RIRARWDCVLVDEFQDLNPIQYAVIRDLGREHGHVFAVGDEEQSIYSWAGADPKVFLDFLNDFSLTTQVSLRENRRCPRELVVLAEARFLSAGIPCRLAQGRALADDPIISYVVAALGVIACPDDIHQEEYLATVLPAPLVDSARARAEAHGRSLLEQLDHLR